MFEHDDGFGGIVGVGVAKLDEVLRDRVERDLDHRLQPPLLVLCEPQVGSKHVLGLPFRVGFAGGGVVAADPFVQPRNVAGAVHVGRLDGLDLREEGIERRVVAMTNHGGVCFQPIEERCDRERDFVEDEPVPDRERAWHRRVAQQSEAVLESCERAGEQPHPGLARHELREGHARLVEPEVLADRVRRPPAEREPVGIPAGAIRELNR